jgi:hypothetical protein
VTPQPITPQAIAIYRRMRAHERKHGCDDEWLAMNRDLAACFGLYEGMVVYEDPAWESDRPMQSAIDMFHELERASRKQPKRKHRYKWER